MFWTRPWHTPRAPIGDLNACGVDILTVHVKMRLFSYLHHSYDSYQLLISLQSHFGQIQYALKFAFGTRTIEVLLH